ncbi:MAG TPA: fluoride efflux transporter CrcB [Chitinophagaceae bacterium]|nr:fluoride efflux transporter CrcB [Chitinophagaceae bacterium]
MYRNILLVGIGSFFGGACRYLVQTFIQKHFMSSFPLGTLLVNVSGCLLIGCIYGLADRGNLLSPDIRIFLATGICGGYTTFSTFAFENISLMKDGEWMYTGLYLSASIIFGLAATYLGSFLIKSV